MPFFDKLCSFATFFKACCSLAVISMVGYWMYKYYQDEDLCLVDYKSIQDVHEESLPVLSMCFYNPFEEDKLKQLDPKFNATYYVEHLKGSIFEEKFKQARHQNLEFDLNEYRAAFVVMWKNGTKQIFKEKDVQPIVYFSKTFDGFYYGYFMSCYGLGVNEPYTKEISFSMVYFGRNDHFDRKLIDSDSIYAPFTFIHYRNQFLHTPINIKNLKIDTNRTVNSNVGYVVNSIEILKRRDKRGEPCQPGYVNLDKYMIERHIDNVKCRPPYLMEPTNHPMCNTQEEIKRSTFDLKIRSEKGHVKPCLGMSKVDFQYTTDWSERNNTWIGLGIVYPEQMKIIVQSQAVDIHSLVGNIGGYIGLFLGINV